MLALVHRPLTSLERPSRHEEVNHDPTKFPKGGCAVRAYRHGLGRRFLLAFANQRPQQHYVLIDAACCSARRMRTR